MGLVVCVNGNHKCSRSGMAFLCCLIIFIPVAVFLGRRNKALRWLFVRALLVLCPDWSKMEVIRHSAQNKAVYACHSDLSVRNWSSK